MQRARLVFDGAVYIWRGLPQLSSRISARLSKRREAMAMGSDQMADLDSIEVRINERSASSVAGDDLLHADARARFATQSDELSPSWTGTVDERTWIRINCQLRQTSPPERADQPNQFLIGLAAASLISCFPAFLIRFFLGVRSLDTTPFSSYDCLHSPKTPRC